MAYFRKVFSRCLPGRQSSSAKRCEIGALGFVHTSLVWRLLVALWSLEEGPGQLRGFQELLPYRRKGQYEQIVYD